MFRGLHVSPEVALAEGHSASTILFQLLSDAVHQFPGTLSAANFPSTPSAFKKIYSRAIPEFEAARQASPQRYDIARHILKNLQTLVVFDPGTLHQALQHTLPPLALKQHRFTGKPGWAPNLVYRGERWSGDRLSELGQLLASRHVITPEASQALAWVQDRLDARGELSLSRRKIAVLGAGAEMAPTRLWLECGADVLWLDTRPPPHEWFKPPACNTLAGQLTWVDGNINLLTQPQQILASLAAFADGHPVDVGLYAYAPGKARELLLTSTMNAVVDALPANLIASITLLVSPTTPAALTRDDLDCVQQRLRTRPGWETLLARCGILGRGPGHVSVNGSHTTRTVVNIQGASYQAAQYLGKVLAADCWTHAGANSRAVPLRVSANTAAITRTRSLAHPVFTAAFGGAAAFGVETMVPRQSRRLNGLLALHDWLNPSPPRPGAIRVHGGIHTLPYPLTPALRIAAAIGFARSPRLLRGLFTSN